MEVLCRGEKTWNDAANCCCIVLGNYTDDPSPIRPAKRNFDGACVQIRLQTGSLPRGEHAPSRVLAQSTAHQDTLPPRPCQGLARCNGHAGLVAGHLLFGASKKAMITGGIFTAADNGSLGISLVIQDKTNDFKKGVVPCC